MMVWVKTQGSIPFFGLQDTEMCMNAFRLLLGACFEEKCNICHLDKRMSLWLEPVDQSCVIPPPHPPTHTHTGGGFSHLGVVLKLEATVDHARFFFFFKLKERQGLWEIWDWWYFWTKRLSADVAFVDSYLTN